MEYPAAQPLEQENLKENLQPFVVLASKREGRAPELSCNPAVSRMDCHTGCNEAEADVPAEPHKDAAGGGAVVAEEVRDLQEKAH